MFHAIEMFVDMIERLLFRRERGSPSNSDDEPALSDALSARTA